jgi:pimeloyl-ACP methyl ester carboxylesterase
VPTVGNLSYLEAAPRPSTDSARAVERAGRTLLLLHAFPLSAKMWEPQLALADEGWRVIAPDFASSSTTPRPTMDDYAGRVIDLLDSLRLHDAVIAGLSMGGYVAFAMFRHAPRYVQGLILSDTRAEADTPQAVEGRQKMQALLDEKGQIAIADDMIPKLLGETTRETMPAIVERVRALVLASSRESISGALNALMTRPDCTSLLSSIHCPTLVVVGEEDTVTPRPLSEKMQQAIPGAELAVIPRAGHLSSFEQPVLFNQTLARFLAHRV